LKAKGTEAQGNRRIGRTEETVNRGRQGKKNPGRKTPESRGRTEEKKSKKKEPPKGLLVIAIYGKRKKACRRWRGIPPGRS